MFESTVAGFLESRRRHNAAGFLLDEIVFRSSLVRRVSRSESFEFTHLSFQDFFAAQWAQRTLEKADVQRLIVDEWWRTSVRFYCGLTRTLDGIVPKRKAISRGKIMWLGDYLLEADYTSAATKTAVLDLIEEELAFSGAVEDREIGYASKFGDDLVSRLARRSRSDVKQLLNTFNYLRLLIVVDSPLSCDLAVDLLKAKDRLGNNDQRVTCLFLLASKVRAGVWAQWALRLLNQMHHGW